MQQKYVKNFEGDVEQISVIWYGDVAQELETEFGDVTK
jgi:hypothetical protein